MNKEFNLEEAEEFIDNIYQHKFDDMEEILEDGTKIVHLGGLDDIKFTDFESSSFTLLRGEQRLKHQVKKQKEVIDKATNELFILKDMIYKPETREENFEIQRKISSIIKILNGKEVSE